MSLGGGSLGTKGALDPDNGTDVETRAGGIGLDLAIGGTPARGFVIGGDYAFQQGAKPHANFSSPTGSSETDSPNNLNLQLLGVFTDWFPDPRGGFHVGGTLGLARLYISDDKGHRSDSNAKKGGGVALRVGYDFWVGSQWSLGILGQFLGARVSSDSSRSVIGRDSVASFGLFFTALYH